MRAEFTGERAKPRFPLATGRNSGISFPPILEVQVKKIATHKAPKLIAWRKLMFDERVVLHRVDTGTSGGTS